jgi:hypothetical protein
LSRTIFGLIIDFSQVIMLSFIYPLAESNGSWFVEAFHVEVLNSIKGPTSKNAFTNWDTTGAVILATFAGIVSLIMIIVLLAVLLIRLVLLMVYTVLSPLIFLGFAFPPLQKYVGTMWQDFIKQVMVGPILAFFIWLALTTAHSSTDTMSKTAPQDIGAFESAFFQNVNLQEYMVTLALLIGGLIATQQIGGAAGQAAGRGMTAVKGAGRNMRKAGVLPIKSGADKLHEKTGVDLNLQRAWGTMQEERQRQKGLQYSRGVDQAGQAIKGETKLGSVLPGRIVATTGTPGHAWNMITSKKGVKQLWQGKKGGQEQMDKLDEKIESKQGERENTFSQDEYNKLEKDIEGSVVERESKKEEIKKKKEEKEKQQAEKRRLAGEGKVGTDEYEEVDQQLKNTDNEIERLENEKESLDEQIEQKEKKRRKVDKGEMTVDDKKANTLDSDINKLKQQKQSYVPMYNAEARRAEQKSVKEALSHIQDISDSNELSGMLAEAIAEGRKNEIKAITKQMAKNGDANEYLVDMTGGTDYEHLQEFSKALAGKSDREDLKHLQNAGFSEQEAYALGSEISNLANSVNQMETSGAFKMEDGRWRPATEEEHVAYSQAQAAKIHDQDKVRKFNRLAYVNEDKQGNVQLKLGGIKILQDLDTKVGRKQVNENMQSNAAQKLSQANLDYWVKKNVLSEDLVKAIKNRAQSGAEKTNQEVVSDIEELKKLYSQSQNK